MSNISGTICRYQAFDGHQLTYRHYEPAGSPRAYVLALHGIQSHSGWYEWSSRRLAAAGFDVRFLDRRGAGINARDNRDAPNQSAVCLKTDVECMIRQMIASGVEERRIILLSVSWGGKLAAALLEGWKSRVRTTPNHSSAEVAGNVDLHQFNPSGLGGAAFLYPAIFTHFDPSFLQQLGIHAANLIGFGSRQIPVPLDDPVLFTDDPDWQKFIAEDPLTLREVHLSFLKATLQLTHEARQYPACAPPPTFVALAGRDEIVDLPRTREWATQLPAEKMRMVEYPDARHTLEFDACREQFVADLIDWIESTIPTRA